MTPPPNASTLGRRRTVARYAQTASRELHSVSAGCCLPPAFCCLSLPIGTSLRRRGALRSFYHSWPCFTSVRPSLPHESRASERLCTLLGRRPSALAFFSADKSSI